MSTIVDIPLPRAMEAPFARERQWPAIRGAEFLRPLFQHIVENCPIPVLVTRVTADDEPIVYVSPALERLLGYDAREMIGLDWRKLLSYRADAAPGISSDHAVLSDNILSTRRKDGTPVHLQARFSPLFTEAGLGFCVLALRDVTDESRLNETLEFRAHHDALTGLANRYALDERFKQTADQAERRGMSFALVLLDLDGFKQINDRRGHATGDEVLRFFAERLMELVRAEDTVARHGGDEFVLLLVDGPDPEAIRAILERVAGSLASLSPAVETSCTAGVARFPEDGRTLEALLEVADRRLYAAKP